MSHRDKKRTKKFNFLEFCQDIYLGVVVTYLLAHTAWENTENGPNQMTKTLYFDFAFMSRRVAYYLFYKNYQ